MKLTELSHPVTSQRLNESLAKKFGYSVKLEQFSDVQLEDARNKLRTKIFQFENTEGFNEMIESHDYQKTRMFLDVVNKAIQEREMTKTEKEKETEIKSKTDKSGMKKSMQKQYGKDKGKSVYFATIRKQAMKERAEQLSVPDSWIESALNRIELGESDHDELKAELALRYDVNEASASWMLCEGEEDKAEIIMATKDMVDRVSGWLEDVAAMKAEQLLELLDSIREQLGSDVSEQYSQAIRQPLETLYSTLESTRGSINQGLSIISGGEPATMGEPAVGSEAPAATGATAELGAAAPTPEIGVGATPPATETGREKRESVDYSRRLGMMLSSQKKK